MLFIIGRFYVAVYQILWKQPFVPGEPGTDLGFHLNRVPCILISFNINFHVIFSYIAFKNSRTYLLQKS